MTKALFFDIDGTLVSFETHRIPSSTIEALEAAHAKGLKIFVGEEVIYKSAIPQEEVKAMAAFCEKKRSPLHLRGGA